MVRLYVLLIDSALRVVYTYKEKTNSTNDDQKMQKKNG